MWIDNARRTVGLWIREMRSLGIPTNTSRHLMKNLRFAEFSLNRRGEMSRLHHKVTWEISPTSEHNHGLRSDVVIMTMAWMI